MIEAVILWYVAKILTDEIAYSGRAFGFWVGIGCGFEPRPVQTHGLLVMLLHDSSRSALHDTVERDNGVAAADSITLQLIRISIVQVPLVCPSFSGLQIGRTHSDNTKQTLFQFLCFGEIRVWLSTCTLGSVSSPSSSSPSFSRCHK